MISVAYNIIVPIVCLGAVLWLRRRAKSVSAFTVIAAAFGTVGFLAALAMSPVFLRPHVSGFLALRLLAYGLFVYTPLFLLASAWVLRASRGIALLGTAVGALILAVGVDAFFIEPTRLQLTRYTVESKRVTRPMRIAVLADIQTDVIGDHERRAVQWAMESEPDLIVLPGDFIQTSNKRDRVNIENHARVEDEFTALLAEFNVSAPLGAFAVQGDIDGGRWLRIFEDLPIQAIPDQEQFVLRDDVVLTTLPIGVSHYTEAVVPRPSDGPLHIALGHGPNFAMSSAVDADLLLTGHTHGGQVQLPFIGPIMTLSRVPRAWAAGALTVLDSGATLIVSKGIGLERGAAPRLRFRCPPEVVIVDVVPARRALPGAER